MKNALLAVVAIAGAGYGVYRWQSEPAPAPKHDEDLVTDRLWIDHLPRGERDVIQIFVAITEEPMGVFQAASRWKGEFELFRYEAHGDEFRLVFPQTGTRDRVKAKATECNHGGMDYCLELEGSSRGVKKYYSREGWEIGNVRDIEKLTQQLASEQ
ncbi:MAG TPA: hypothetical protein VIV11_04160 [Kofleriaceae bacterium]